MVNSRLTWPRTRIWKSSYLRGRIGWQGLRASEFCEDGPYLITGTDIVAGRVNWDTCYHVSEERYAEAQYIHVQNDDVLVTKDGTIGKIALVDKCPHKAVLNSGVFLLRCIDDSYLHQFIFHILQSHLFRRFLEDNLAGSTIQHLYQYVFEQFEFPVPPRPEQFKIAEVLSTVDRAIVQTEALITKQQRIKIGLMQDLLTRGIDEYGNLRSEATHKFKDSTLGRVPCSWDVAPISKYGPSGRTFLRTGPFGSDLNTKHWVKYGVPVLTIGSLGEGVVLEHELLYINEASAQLLKAFRVTAGDIVFSRVADIGRSLVIRVEQDGWIISSNLMRITLNIERARPDFLHRNIAHNAAIRSQLRTSSNSGGRDLVNGPILRNLMFPWPCVDEQDRINAILDAADSTLRQYRLSLYKLHDTRAGLMHDLLTGHRRVTALLEEGVTA